MGITIKKPVVAKPVVAAAPARKAPGVKKTSAPVEERGLEKTANSANIMLVELEQINLAKEIPNQRDLDTKWVKELSDDIAFKGLTSALGVAQIDGHIILCHGWHRYEALTELKKNKPKRFNELFANGVPVVIVATTVEEALCATVTENVQRRDPSAYDYMTNIADLKKKGMTVEAIARMYGTSATSVRTVLQVHDKGGKEVKEALKDGAISWNNALALMKLDPEKQGAGLAKLKEAKEKGGKHARTGDALSDLGGDAKLTKKELKEIERGLIRRAVKAAAKPTPPKYTDAELATAASLGMRAAMGLITPDAMESGLKRITTTFKLERQSLLEQDRAAAAATEATE